MNNEIENQDIKDLQKRWFYKQVYGIELPGVNRKIEKIKNEIRKYYPEYVFPQDREERH